MDHARDLIHEHDTDDEECDECEGKRGNEITHRGALLVVRSSMRLRLTCLRLSGTAESGLTLRRPGGIAIVLLMPLVGGLVAKVDARKMAAFGFATMSVALFMMTRAVSTGIDFKTATLLRMLQAVGLAFLFVPVNTIAYAELTPEKRNSASGIMNLARNMGGDIGIALVATMVARNVQVHQTVLTSHASRSDDAFTSHIAAVTAELVRSSVSQWKAEKQALAIVYRSVQQQAAALSYLDSIWVLVLLSAAMVPLVFLTRRVTSAGAPGAH
jgi:DHA2 family multidrug resistance protein